MNRRILALWLPTLPTDRLHRRSGDRNAAPLAVMAAQRGG